tara:strand:- start:152656 stop:152910 length:255 start_codon:yes stop_codon:yes gene_type:complete
MISGAMLLRKYAPLETTQLTLKPTYLPVELKLVHGKMISKSGRDPSFEKRLTRNFSLNVVYQNNLIASILIVLQARSTDIIAHP